MWIWILGYGLWMCINQWWKSIFYKLIDGLDPTISTTKMSHCISVGTTRPKEARFLGKSTTDIATTCTNHSALPTQTRILSNTKQYAAPLTGHCRPYLTLKPNEMTSCRHLMTSLGTSYRVATDWQKIQLMVLTDWSSNKMSVGVLFLTFTLKCNNSPAKILHAVLGTKFLL